MVALFRWIAVSIGIVVAAAACAPAPGSGQPPALRAPAECATPEPEDDGETEGDAEEDPVEGEGDEGASSTSWAEPLSATETFLAVVDAVGDEGSDVELVTTDDAGALVVERVHESEVGAQAAAIGDEPDRELVAVDAVEPVSALETDDPHYSNQWANDLLDIPGAWDTSTGCGVTVAVVDTGVDASHPDLSGAVEAGASYLDGGTFVEGDGNVDPHGHGTHVAGTIGARAGNGEGGIGVAPGVEILPVRVLSANGSGWSSDVANGVIWATDNGAHVINLSLGSYGESSAITSAIDYAVDNGVVVVAAAGNSGAGGPASYPAASNVALAVAAINSSGNWASFSTTGDYVDIAAPGASVFSTLPGGTYASWSGTSMATPHVAGLAALLVADGLLGHGDVVDRIVESATDIDAAGHDSKTGAGLIDLEAALSAA